MAKKRQAGWETMSARSLGQSWGIDEARRFLESAYADRDPLYPLWVLILVLGLRKGEAQGLVWSSVDLDNAEVSLEWQIQRVGRQLIHKQHLKTDGSTDVLPLPDICLAALRLQRQSPGAHALPVGARGRHLACRWPGVHHTHRPADRAAGSRSTFRPAVRQGWRAPYSRA